MKVILMKKIFEKYKNMPVPVKAATWFVICSFIQKAISLITTPIFTRIMTKAEYGQVSLYNSWFEIIAIIASFKLSESVFNKTLVDYKENKREVLSAYQILSMLCITMVFVIYLVFNKMINSLSGLSFSIMILMFIQVVFDSVFKLWAAYQRFMYKYVSLIVVTLILSILNPIIGIIAVKIASDKAFARIASIVIVNATVCLFLLKFNLTNINKANFWSISKKAFLFNLPLIPHYLSQIILNQADRIMINYQVGSEAVAMYSLAYTIGAIVTMITQSINNAYVPWLYNALKERKYTSIKNINEMILIFVAIIICMVYLVAPEVILFLGGKKYLEATQVIYPVAASVFFTFTYTLFANIELYYGNRKYVMIGTICAAILNIIMNYFGIKMFGYVAAAYTTLICYIIYGVFHIFIAEKILMKQTGNKFDCGKIIDLICGSICIIISFISPMLQSYWYIRYSLIIITFMILIIKREKILYFYKKLKNT